MSAHPFLKRPFVYFFYCNHHVLTTSYRFLRRSHASTYSSTMALAGMERASHCHCVLAFFRKHGLQYRFGVFGE